LVWGNVPGSIGAADVLGAALATEGSRCGGGGIGAIDALSAETSEGGSAREHARSAAAIIAKPGFGGVDMKSILLALPLVLACDPPPQGPQQVTYQNGYAQQGPAQPGNGYGGAQPTSGATAATPAVTYAPTETAATANPTMSVIAAPTATAMAAPTATTAAPVTIQTTPVPLGVQPMPLPSATTTAMTPLPSPQQTQSKMATPGTGAFQCTSDAQCLLGKCNVQFGRCAYPCKTTENDCKAGNVCTASGVCLPKAAAGIKM
jgi:hypothetical protein